MSVSVRTSFAEKNIHHGTENERIRNNKKRGANKGRMILRRKILGLEVQKGRNKRIIARNQKPIDTKFVQFFFAIFIKLFDVRKRLDDVLNPFA